MATMKTLNGYGFNATELNGKTSDSYLQLGDDETGSTGAAPTINADTLGGVAASNYLKKTDTASDTSKLGGKAPEYYLQPRNLLDNSDFRNPVNQRGKTNYTGGSYTIDRWLLGINAVVVNVLDDGIEVTGGDSTYNAPYIQKVPENLTGKTVTFAVCDSDGVIETVTGTVQTDSECSTNTTYGSITFYHASSDDTLWVQINVKYGGSKIFRWAALYEGSYTADTIPPYAPKGYATELAECRLYYRPQQMYCLYCYSSGYAAGISFEPMRPDVIPTPVNAKAQTMTGDAVAGETNIVVIQIDRFSYAANTNFTHGNYYRVFSEFSSDL